MPGSVVAYEDIRRPTTDAPDTPFDPSRFQDARDELLDRFVAETTADARTVEAATVTESDGLSVLFRGGMVLEVDGPKRGSKKEAWRLLLPGGRTPSCQAPGSGCGPPPHSTRYRAEFERWI